MNCGAALSSGPIQGRDIDFPELKPFSLAARLASSIRNHSGCAASTTPVDMSWHKARVFVSKVFRNEEIGLEPWHAMKRLMFKRDEGRDME